MSLISKIELYNLYQNYENVRTFYSNKKIQC